MNIFAVDEAKFLSRLKVKILSLKNSNLIGELLINFLNLWIQVKEKYHIHSEVSLQDFLQLESIFSEVEETMKNDELEGIIVSALTECVRKCKSNASSRRTRASK